MRVVIGPHDKRTEVCKKQFGKLFGRGKTFLDEVIGEVKNGTENSAPALRDRTQVKNQKQGGEGGGVECIVHNHQQNSLSPTLSHTHTCTHA